MEAMKETAANVGASAIAGKEKTKAVVQEKMERMTAHDPMEKEMATKKKEERINQAELNKEEAKEQNAAARQGASTTGTNKPHSYSTTGRTGNPMGAHQMSAMPGHGTGAPMGQVTEGVVESRPIGTATGTQRTTVAHNTHAGREVNKGYGTGGATYN
ncbi:PREDICTED: 18 kDa seed maturation protein-like [Ipomoea nil]|uniref:18 kDa seed maturation protein-like n=1 Tax=Ipomoea nil TaxID=35883 RepID=UPI0009015C3E|nr:PREDICTED: 18 kDa seed maturation protein-like [Ipomoea nil]